MSISKANNLVLWTYLLKSFNQCASVKIESPQPVQIKIEKAE